MWQNLIVGVIVLLAAAYCLWFVLPVTVRDLVRRVHPVLGIGGRICGTCSDCGACAAGYTNFDVAAKSPDWQTIRLHLPPKG